MKSIDNILLNKKKVLYRQNGSEREKRKTKQKKPHTEETFVHSSDKSWAPDSQLCCPTDFFLQKERKKEYYVFQIFVLILNFWPAINATKFCGIIHA